MNSKYQSFGLEDKVAIVTGASQGIGRTLAIALAEAGAHSALVSRTQSALNEVAAEIESMDRHG
jgi:short-subunit dehydrogenase